MKTILVTFWLVVILFPCFGEQNSPKREVLSSFCQFSLSEKLMQSNVSFTESYTFKVGERGKPLDIRRIRGQYLDDEQVKACLSHWEFSGFITNTRVMVDFSWKHGVGWIEMQIRSKDFCQITVLDDERCRN